ncbi:MAG: SDR family oxidoreductase [Candidatus Aminicenantes bacterium]|nr:MAG: SDR family oxidoreductase [Candidatus Aminicenantes bacterium]
MSTSTIVISGGDHPLKNNILSLLRQGMHQPSVIDFDTLLNPAGPGCTNASPETKQAFEKEIIGTVEKILKKYHNIDVFISCPASPGKVNFVDQDSESWESLLHTILTSTLFTCKAVLPKMMKQKFGRIINVISVKALMGESEEVVYSSALGGLVTMAKCVAKEVGRYNITMNNICYGLLDIREQDIREGSTDYAIAKQLSLKRNCSYEDIVNTINFLISAEAAYINGKSIILDGGVL